MRKISGIDVMQHHGQTARSSYRSLYGPPFTSSQSILDEYGSIFKLQMNVTIRPQNHLLPSSNLLG